MARVTQAHIDARTQDILDAAKSLFAHRGVDETTMQDIAADAGISAGAIYRYYASKDDLLRAVFQECTEKHRALFEETSASSGSPLEAISDIGRVAWSKLKTERAKEEALLDLETALAAARHPTELGPVSREVVGDLVEILGRFIGDAQAAGEIDGDVDVKGLALTLIACHVGSEMLSIEGVDTDIVCESLLDMVRRLAPVAGRNGGT